MDQSNVISGPARIELDEFKRKFDRGEPVYIIDTRSPRDREASDVKIPGAVRLHFRDIEARLDELPRDRTIVTYCT
jgi:rhodanese-related sulfurtransferase